MSTLHRISFFLIFTSFLPLPTSAEQLDACGNNEQAKMLAHFITTDEQQKRNNIRCNKMLTMVAEAKARRMADYGLVMHNLGGSPNSRLEDAGYKLPDHYGKEITSNQVEAIAGGYSNADEVWDAFKRSEQHRSHLLGEHTFYLDQDEMGVAMVKVKGSRHIEYWVVYLTQGYEKNQSYSSDPDDIPNKNIFILEREK